MQDNLNGQVCRHAPPWNWGKMIGPKPPLHPGADIQSDAPRCWLRVRPSSCVGLFEGPLTLAIQKYGQGQPRAKRRHMRTQALRLQFHP
jgi:hypothetical protein